MERRGVGREVVVAEEDQARLDAQRLHRGEAVGADAERLAGVEQRAPEALGVLGRGVDLVAELARVARARDEAAGHVADRDVLEEAEVAQGFDVGVRQRREQLARLGPLQLEVRHLGGALDDLGVEPLVGDRTAEVVAVGRERRDDEDARVVVARVVDGAVAEHPAALVAERAVANLADLAARPCRS